jgi:hypothetical protein
MKGFTTYTPFSASAEALLSEANTGSSNGRVFRGVTIIKAGLGNMQDKHLYTPAALKKAVDAGHFTDLRAFVDHPRRSDERDQPERTVRDLAGVYRSPQFIEDDKGARVVADFHILASQDWLAQGIRELADMGLGDKIGISILGGGRTTKAKHMTESGEIPVDRVDEITRL